MRLLAALFAVLLTFVAWPSSADSNTIELKAPKPAWLTAELEQRVIEEGVVAAPAAAPKIPGPPADLPGAGYVGIRPGSWMVSPSGCTMNFVFGSRGNYSIGTAGHCGKTGEPVVLLTLAPSGNDTVPVLVNIGTIAKSVDQGVGNDFAVVPVRTALQSWVYPTIAQVGGPCGKYTGDGTLPDVQSPFRGANPVEAGQTVYHYGHGLAIGTGGTPRAGAAMSWNSSAFFWASPSIFGDSGSAVRIEDFRAAGDLTHLVVGTNTAPAFVAGTRIAKMEQIAGKPLANSPYCF